MAEKFPIYLEITNGQSIYKLLSDSEMIETQTIGRKYIQHRMVAKIYPEKVLIADMISNEGNRWLRLDQSDYENKLNLIQSTLEPLS